MTGSAAVYTASEVVMFIAAIGVLITGVGAVIVNIIVALRQGHKVDALGTAVEQVYTEAKVITGHVNSAATAAAAKIDALQRELEQIKISAAEMKTTAALLAQSASQKPDKEK